MMRVEQLGLFLRDNGLDSVENNNLTWVERMREIAKKISIEQGEVCADDLRRIADRANDNPDHVNAWGAVFRGSQWRVIGRRKSITPSAHAREIKVWRYLT
jgi:hypothetical protein